MALKVNTVFISLTLSLICGLVFCSALPNGKRTVDSSRKLHQRFDAGTTKEPDFPECTVQNYKCSDISPKNLIQEFKDVHTNEGCKQRCVENSDCTW